MVEICYWSLENPREESMNIEHDRMKSSGFEFQKVAKILMFDQQLSLDLFKTLGRPHTAFETFLQFHMKLCDSTMGVYCANCDINIY